MTEISNKIEQFTALVTLAFSSGAIKKLVFSRPRQGEEKKVTARLVKHKERRILACEYALPGDTVRHKNLTEAELDLLPAGAKMMTLECGMRFLTDYIDGDTYFKTAYPEHNLVRCRTQFKLVEEMESMWDEMKAVIDKYK